MKPKLKIMSSKPEITDEEIQGLMNFEGLLREVKSKPRTGAVSTPVKTAIVIGGLASIALISYFYFIGTGHQEIPKETSEPRTNSKNFVQPDPQTTPVPVPSDSGDLKHADELKTAIGQKSTSKSTEKPERQKEEAAKQDGIRQGTEAEYMQAEPVAGFPQLYEYFNLELKYPEEAVKDSIQGVVTISFIINPEGKPEKLKILNSLGEPFDKEVIRLIQDMPAWKPATLNNKPVPSRISMPLTFRLERIKK